MLSPFSHVRLFATLWTVVFQAPLSIGFPRQEYSSGLLFPSPGNLPEPASLRYPALGGRFFPTSTTWEAHRRSNLPAIFLSPVWENISLFVRLIYSFPQMLSAPRRPPPTIFNCILFSTTIFSIFLFRCLSFCQQTCQVSPPCVFKFFFLIKASFGAFLGGAILSNFMLSCNSFLKILIKSFLTCSHRLISVRAFHPL